MARFYRVHEAAVQSFLAPGQPVYDMIYDISKDARDNAKFIVPKRTGDLMRSISAGRPDRTGAFGLSGYVSSNRKYAEWVHDGTTGPIRSHSGKKMKFRSNKGNGPFVYKKVVRGQTGVPFLARGLQTAMAKFRAGG